MVRLTGPGFAVAHCRLPAWEAGAYASRSAPSSIGLSFTRQACDVRAAGAAAATSCVVEAGHLVVVGPEATEWMRVATPSEIVEVSADAGLRASLADELSVGASADLGDLALPADAAAWAITARLRAQAGRGEANEADVAGEVEALVRLLYGRLLRDRFGGRLRERGDGALDARRLARVAEHVEAQLGERDGLGLGALASVAALSPFHFQRSFRRAAGCSPHQYVALRRAERARALLAAGRSPAEAARLSGLGSIRRLRAVLQ